MSMLEQKLRSLIARDLGVSPDKITPQFIHEQREKLSNLKLVLDSKYGGHRTDGLTVLTDKDIEENHKIAEAFWAEIGEE